MREILITTLEIGGLALIVTAGFVVHTALGLLLAGLMLLLVAFALERSRR